MSFEVNSPRGKLTSNGKRENSVVDNSHKVMFEAGGLLPPEVRTGTGNSRYANTPPSMRAAPERIDPFKHRQIRALTNSRDDKAQPKYEIGIGWLAGPACVKVKVKMKRMAGDSRVRRFAPALHVWLSAPHSPEQRTWPPRLRSPPLQFHRAAV